MLREIAHQGQDLPKALGLLRSEPDWLRVREWHAALTRHNIDEFALLGDDHHFFHGLARQELLYPS